MEIWFGLHSKETVAMEDNPMTAGTPPSCDAGKSQGTGKVPLRASAAAWHGGIDVPPPTCIATIGVLL